VELLARLQAIRRRRGSNAPAASPNFDDGRLRLEFANQQAYLGGEPLSLTPTEYRLLGALVRNAGRILSSEKLIELAWDGRSDPGPARVKYAVLRLRRKLGWDTDDSPIATVRGFGYRYDPLIEAETGN
jgi:DNA-binding response OmpR family regulator